MEDKEFEIPINEEPHEEDSPWIVDTQTKSLSPIIEKQP